MNKFGSTIKEVHYKTTRAIYQIPDHIPIRLPYKSEKCYYDGMGDLGVYEQALKAGLRFLLNRLKREFLQHLGLSVSQISPIAWRVFIAMEVLEGDGWMCHPGETDVMPVDRTWGILDPSGIVESVVSRCFL